jgi:hypothetical protein
MKKPTPAAFTGRPSIAPTRTERSSAPLRLRSVIPFPAWKGRVSRGSLPWGRFPAHQAFGVRLHPAGLNPWSKPYPPSLFHGRINNRLLTRVINPERCEATELRSSHELSGDLTKERAKSLRNHPI